MEETYRALTDQELELMAARGEREAFAALYDRHADRVYDFALRLVRDSHEAADVVQETFLRAMKALKPEEKQAAFSTWVFTIARNVALTRIEKRGRTSTSLDAEPRDDESLPPALNTVDPSRFADPEEAARASEMSELVWQAAAFLNPKEASILDLHLRQGLDSAEIAGVLGISKGNAYTVLSRLKSAFEEAVVALVMTRNARKQCTTLDRLLSAEASAILSASLRRLITKHVKECEACQGARERLLSPSALFGGFALMPLPAAMRLNIGEAIQSQWHLAPAAAAASGGAATLASRVSKLLLDGGRRLAQIASEQVRNVTVTWPYQTALWKGAHVGVALLVAGGISTGGTLMVTSQAGGETAPAVQSETAFSDGQTPPPAAVAGVYATPAPSATGATPGSSIAAPGDSDRDGLSVAQGDCNDSDPNVRPGKRDIPNNGIDENCDGGDATVVEQDGDGDAIPDSRDACPRNAEDFDGYEDQDGCPEPGPTGSTVITPTPPPTRTATRTASPTATVTPHPPTLTPTPPNPPTAPPTTAPPTPPLELRIWVGGGSVASGGSITVTLEATAPGNGIGSYIIDVAFDGTVVDAIAPCVAHPSGLCNPDASSGIRVTGSSPGGLTGIIKFADIQFRGVGASGSCSDLHVELTELRDPDGADLRPVQTTDGRICVS